MSLIVPPVLDTNSYDRCSYGLYSFGLYIYGLNSYGLYSHSLIVLAYIVMAYMVTPLKLEIFAAFVSIHTCLYTAGLEDEPDRAGRTRRPLRHRRLGCLGRLSAGADAEPM